MTQSKITASQGRQHITQRKSSEAIMLEIKRRLDYLQATDWEMILVGKTVSLLLSEELLLILLLIVWQVNTRGETNMSTFECTQQDILNVT